MIDVDNHPTSDERYQFRQAVLSTIIGACLLGILLAGHRNWSWFIVIPGLVIQVALGFREFSRWRRIRKDRLERKAAFQTWRERLSSVPPPPR